MYVCVQEKECIMSTVLSSLLEHDLSATLYIVSKIYMWKSFQRKDSLVKVGRQ